MAEYKVPIKLPDGRIAEFPVTADSEEQAIKAVQSAIQSGQLELSVVIPAPKFQPKQSVLDLKQSPMVGMNPAAASPETAAGIISGINRGAMNVAEFGMLAADAAVPERLFPDADAAVSAAKTRFQEWRRQHDQRLQAHFDEVLGPHFQASGVDQAIGEALLFSPLASVGQGKTWLQGLRNNIGLGSFEGAVAGSQGAEKLSDVLGEASIGAIFGFGASAVQAGKGVRGLVARQFARELDKEIAKSGLALERQVQRMTGNPDFHFNVAQLSAQNPWLIGLERGSGRSEIFLQRQNKRLQTLVEFLQRRGDGMAPETFVNDLHTTMSEALSEIHDIAGKNYGRHMESIIEAYGDEIVLDGRKYLDDLRAFRGELGDPRKIGSAAHNELLRHERFVDLRVRPFKAAKSGGQWAVIDRRDGSVVETFGAASDALKAAGARNSDHGLTADDVIEILKGHNELMSGKRSLLDVSNQGSAEHIAKYLKASMLSSMDGSSSAAVKSIRDANRAFQFDMNRARTLQNTVLGRIFNVKEEQVMALLADPDAVLARLSQFSPTGMANARAVLDQYAPELVDEMKRTILARAVENSADVATSEGMYLVDIGRLAENLKGSPGSGLSNKVGGLGLGLFGPDEQAEIVAAARALRRLQTTAIKDIGKDTTGLAADAVINMVSRSKEFFARWATRVLGQSDNVGELMSNPAARQALMALSKESPNSVTGRLAIVWLTSFVGNLQAERQEQLAEELRQRTLETPASSMQPGLR